MNYPFNVFYVGLGLDFLSGKSKTKVNFNTNQYIKTVAVAIWHNQLTTLAKVVTMPISFPQYNSIEQTAA